MRTLRFRILAVEPDPACGEMLRQLIEGRSNAEVVVPNSPEAAVGVLSSPLPDVVLLSSLLPPIGEDQVMWQLRRTDPEHRVPVLIPPVVHLVEPEATARRFGLFKRRSSPRRLGTYDPVALGTRIVEALQQSRSACTTSSMCDHELAAQGFSTTVVKGRRGNDAIVRQRPSTGAAPDVLIFSPRSKTRSGRAPRLGAAELPWCSLKTRDGTEVDLLNFRTAASSSSLP